MPLTPDDFVPATTEAPAVQARAVLDTARRRLLTGLRPKVALLTDLELDAAARESALAALTDFCTGPVRRHLNATDQVLYASAADVPETRLLVRALRTAATVLERDIVALARTDDPHRAKAVARRIEAHLTTHLAMEQTVLVPALDALPGVELAALATQFTTALDGDRPVPARSDWPTWLC